MTSLSIYYLPCFGLNKINENTILTISATKWIGILGKKGLTHLILNCHKQI